MSTSNADTHTVLVEERRLGGRWRQRTISISVSVWAVRDRRSSAAVAQAEQLLAAVQRRAPRPGAETAGAVERMQLQELKHNEVQR